MEGGSPGATPAGAPTGTPVSVYETSRAVPHEPGRGTFLIGYDVEARDPAVTQPFLRQALAIHEATGVPATLFLAGRTIDLNREALRPLAEHPLFDFQQHTYNHVLLKTVCIEDPVDGIRLFRAGTLDQIRDEVRRTSTLLREEFGLDCTGLTGPYAYYRGLVDRPDILEILWQEGIRFTRTWGRNERDWQPVPLEVQPFWYRLQGFPELLEVPLHGWQDISLRKSVGWTNHDGFLDATYPYLEAAAAGGLTFSYCTHDHSSTREDPQMRITAALLRRARELGLATTTYRDYYQQLLAHAPAPAQT
ncbi:MAG TPA: polysaccharide deacetylase family protein [Chloroflexota bacterium]|nr:polysaccharide deacetylase family protein [Chloroflexota bacterium]